MCTYVHTYIRLSDVDLCGFSVTISMHVHAYIHTYVRMHGADGYLAE